MSAPLHLMLITADEAPSLRIPPNHIWQRVSTLSELRTALGTLLWDVAVLDADLPGIPVATIAAVLRERELDLPLIVVSDHVDELSAVAALRAGARDLLPRDQPSRLALVIELAAQEARERHDRRRAEAEVARQAARAESLLRVAGRLNGHLDRGAVISAICEEALRALAADMACVALHEQAPGGEPPAIVGCAGHSQPLVSAALPVVEQFLTQPAGQRQASEGWTVMSARLLVGERCLGSLVAAFASQTRLIGADDRALLSGLADQASIALDNALLLADLQASHSALATAYDATLEGWVQALDMRDKESEGHTRRVTTMTTRIASALGFAGQELEHIRRGALLHDIGKLAVPDRILHKPGPLDDDEWAVVRRHPVYAYEWLAPIPFLRPALDIPYCHHERWDGGGYPRGLHTQSIPMPARIFALADTWDALRSERPYKPAYSEVQALQIITAETGRQFDPAVVSTFLRLLPELRARTI